MIEEVIATAEANVGYTEGKNNSNIFAEVAGHANNQPWCATFIIACFIMGGAPKAIKNSASCIAIEQWANKHKRGIPLSQAKRGDVLLFDFDGHGVSQHIGLAVEDYKAKTKTIRTIEGNTSGGKGSQTNGDGVYRKIRGSNSIRMAIRPDWSNK